MVSRRSINIQSSACVLILALIAAYCVPAIAQTANPQSADTQAGNQSQGSSTAAQPAQSSQQPSSDSTQNSNAPQSQQPVTTYPDATTATPQSTAPGTPDAPQPKAQQNVQTQSEPQGAATAEKVTTAGGAAAKPAGVAIAPAKQHQTRSLLIKVGAALAAGAAAGTVYALSRGTSSTPPGATTPGVVQKH